MQFLDEKILGAKGSLEAPREPCSFVHNNSVPTYAAVATLGWPSVGPLHGLRLRYMRTYAQRRISVSPRSWQRMPSLVLMAMQ